ncbi:MAG: ComEC/Rec2 family competence protein [Eubacteriales bacterium]|nr:ComEC/Rec2 family competence protein [Eubacteriales bacterium]
MKRPAIWFSAFFAAGVALELWQGPRLALLLFFAVFCVLGILLSRLVNLRAVVVVCLVGILLGGLYASARALLFEQPRYALAGTTKQQITVTAVDYPTVYGEQQRVSVSIPADELGQHFRMKTFLYLPVRSQPIRPGDSITANISFYVPTSSDAFDRATYYRSLGYPVLARAETDYPIFLKTTDRIPIFSYPRAVGYLFSQQIGRLFSERNASFLSALLVGDRSNLSTVDANHLRKAGLSHVIAVSGLHVGFLVTLLLFLLGRRVGAFLGIPILVLFLLMVGCSPSVLRACIMYGVVLLAFVFRREADSVNSLFFALLLCLLWQPAALLSASLQLSFASTLGILCFAGRIQKALMPPAQKLPRIPFHLIRFLTASVACSLSSLLLTWPILLYHFRYLSVFSLFANLLALWAVTLVFPLGFLVCVLSLFSAPVAAILAVPVSALSTYIWWIADLFARIPGGILYCTRWIDCLLLGLVLVVWGMLLYRARRRTIAFSIPIFLVCLILYSYGDVARMQHTWKMTCLSEGENQAIVVTHGEQLALIDCGGSGDWKASDDVCEYLDWWGYDQVDLLIITSLDQAHAESVSDLAERVSIQSVILPDSATKQAEVLCALFGDTCQIVSETKTPTALGVHEFHLSVLPIDNCLAVRLAPAADTIWILHSLHPSQLSLLMAEQPMHSTAMVLSSSYLEEEAASVCEDLETEQIILESAWETTEELAGIPVTTVKQTGDYTKTYLYP